MGLYWIDSDSIKVFDLKDVGLVNWKLHAVVMAADEAEAKFIYRLYKEGRIKPELKTIDDKKVRVLSSSSVPILSLAARALGQMKSQKKAKSSRENGKKGGRPRKSENASK